MQVLKLELQAFGPFASKQTIDFTSFTESKLFIISGKTGSGKSTIFDAICYALYGTTSIERNLTQLYSDFAELGTKSYVDLTWITHHERYRIVRYPQQMREKKRGTGFVEEATKVELYCNDQLVETKIKDVNQRVIELIGLDINQFRQIALLAQGEFKKLLLAESRDRELIFRKIFNTNHLLNLQEKYKEKAINLKNSVTKSETEINALLQQINKEEAFTTYERFKELLENINKQYTEQQEEIQKKIKAVKSKQTEALKCNEINLEYNKLKVELDQNQHKWEYLINQAQQIDEKTATIDLYNQAKELFVKLQELQGIDEQEVQLQTQSAEIKQLHIEKQTYAELLHDVQLPTIIERLDLFKAELVKLETSKEERAKSLPRLQQAVSLKKTIENNDNRLAQLEITIQAIKQTLNEIQTAKITIVQLESQIETSSMKVKELEHLTSLQQKHQDVQAKLSIKNNTLDELKTKLIVEQAAYIEMESQYYAYTSGVLAAQLQAGEACSVCGSIDHPSPAKFSQFEVSAEQLLQAKNKLTIISKQHDELCIEIQTLQQQLTLMELELVEDINFEQELSIVQTAIKNMQETLQVHVQKISLEETNNIKLETEKIEYETVTQSTKIAKQQLAELNVEGMRVEEVETEINSLNDQITALKQKIVSTEQKISQIEQASTNYNRIELLINEKETNYTKSAEILIAKKENLNLEINTFCQNHEISFANFAKLSELNIINLVQNVENYKLEKRSVTDKISEIQAKILTLEPNIDPDLEEKNRSLETQIDDLTNELGQSINAQKNVLNVAEEIEKIYLNNKMKIEQYHQINTISNMVNGRSKPYISLERYVLSAYFKQIIEYANIRFNKLTDGRYQFKVSSDFKSGQVRQGLDLSILDFYTGKERDISSLSGGESFKASISLALGLSDVVRFENGGVELNSLFIDEGFGTLDEESLDQAIDVILDLEADGRMVGIISHVNELKTQIRQQILVERTNKGSSVNIQN